MRPLMTRFLLALALCALPMTLPSPSTPPALAAVDGAAVQRTLDDDAGWTPHSTKDGIQVYAKSLPSIGLTAFKGVGLFQVDGDRLFTLISDLPAHLSVTGNLHESVTIAQNGNITDYYQVMKSPGPLLSQRYWFNRSTNTRNVKGTAGHAKRAWATLDAALYPEVRQAVATRYPDAVAITMTFGSWEVIPESPGRSHLIYRAVSHPGGNIPTSVAATAASQTLPDNMMSFVRAVGGVAVVR